MDKIFYNQASSEKLGWTPEWFGCDEFDEKLVKSIRKWQSENGLKADGLCGPGTHRRIVTYRLSQIDEYEPEDITEKDDANLVYRGNFIPIDWGKVVLWSEEKGLNLNSKNYRPYFEKRKINSFVNHWDVCLSSKSCASVLNKRGLSVHFLIDNDGTIYQLCDINHMCFHAGSKVNPTSIGVEISNAYYLKYQNWYEKRGFGKRPIVEGETVHGRSMKPFTDFYPVQIEALKALWKSLHDGIGIPLECPVDENNNTLKRTNSKCARGTFKGFISHYHITSKKIDCSGLDIKTLLGEIK
tara:strand:+ start:326 stop:1219 length:894 start_codon:yes stop_codon:yes gene_type:complete